MKQKKGGDTTMQTEDQRVHNEELQCLVDDIQFKSSLLQIAEKALEDIRAACVSSTCWKNDAYPIAARILGHHHKIVTNAQRTIAELMAIEYGDNVDMGDFR